MTKFILDNCEYGWVPKGSNKEANQKDDIFHNSLNSGNILNKKIIICQKIRDFITLGKMRK